MRSARTLWLSLIIALAVTSAAGPVGAAAPAQRCTRPKPDARAGYAVFRPGLNARPAPQKLTADIQLSTCSPAGATGGTGALRVTVKSAGTQTCALINRAHTIKGTAKLTWKNGQRSTLQITLALSGASRALALSGKVTAGKFAGHLVTGGFRYAPFASHHGTTVEQACADKTAPNQPNRNSVVQMQLFRTKPFVVS